MDAGESEVFHRLVRYSTMKGPTQRTLASDPSRHYQRLKSTDYNTNTLLMLYQVHPGNYVVTRESTLTLGTSRAT